jgi:hypothetical protein
MSAVTLALLAALTTAQGQTPATAAPPAAAPAAPTLGAAEAQDAYERRFLAFEDFTLVNVRTGAQVGGGANIVQGRYKRPVEPGEFYDLVGRQDLATTYRERNGTRTGLFVGAGALGLLSLPVGMGMAALNRDLFVPGLVTGMVGLTAGVGLFFAAVLMNPNPSELHEMREMADVHNRKLRQELGLQEEPERQQERTVQPTVQLMPFVGPSQAGLALGGRF